MKHRPEIDGLRSIAVLPVIFYHAGFTAFAGGFAGVDVFFVISGYLITGLLLEEIERGSFSLLKFYERRVRRILPALVLVIACILPLAWMWLLPTELRDLGKSILAVLFFVANFFFMSTQDYFGADADTLPLLHTWSLSVEEQFYLLFPVLLFAVAKAGKNTVAIVLVALLLASFVAWSIGSSIAPSSTFYLLPTRAWQLLLGAIIALPCVRMGVERLSSEVAAILSLTGLGMVGLGYFAYDNLPGADLSTPVLAVAGAALIISFSRVGAPVTKLLTLRPVILIGLISYSAYLWHQPLFVLARTRILVEPSASIYLVLILLTLVLAYLSWRFVEQPFRRRDMVSTPQIWKWAPMAAALLLAVGIALDSQSGFPQRIDPQYEVLLAYQNDRNPRGEECHSSPELFIEAADACIYGDTENVSVVLWGDSHANALAFEFGRVLGGAGLGLQEFTYSACPPALQLRRAGRSDRCEEFNRNTLAYLGAASSIETVIVSARWPLYVEGSVFDNEEGAIESGPSLTTYPTNFEQGTESERQQQVLAAFHLTIAELIEMGKQVILIYPIPEAGWNVPLQLARAAQLGIERAEYLSSSYAVYQKRNNLVLESFDSLDFDGPLHRIVPASIFCNSALAGRCLQQDSTGPLYHDDDHLNSQGAAMVAEKLLELSIF